MTKCEEIDDGDSDYGEYISAEIEKNSKAGYNCEDIQELMNYFGRFENGVIKIGKATSIPLKHLK